MKVKSLLLALGLSLVVGKSFAISFKVDGINYLANADTAIVKGYSEIPENGELKLASTVTYGGKNYRVTTVQSSAFLSCTDIKKLTVPATIKYIQTSAFENCVNMSNLVLEQGDDVLDAASDAFRKCAIDEAIIGRNYENSILEGNLSLTKVVLCSNIKEINSNAFSGCKNLNDINLEKVESIGNNAFLSCCNLQTASLQSLKVLGNWAFSKTGLQEIELPEALTQFGYAVFQGSALKTAVIRTSITTIPSQSFSDCYNLTSIDFPNTVTEIGSNAFSSCGFAFFDFKNVNRIDKEAFSGCEHLENVEWNNVSVIEFNAFENCGFKSLKFPASLKSIYINVFSSCPKLESVDLSELSLATVVGFENCKALKNVIFPSNVKSLGYRCFANCSSLVNIDLPETLQSISDEAFKNCESIETIKIPASLCSLGREVFANMKRLKQIDLSSTNLQNIPISCFEDCSSLKDVKLPQTISEISKNAFYGCSVMESIDLPNSLQSLGNATFANSKTLKYIDLTNTKIHVIPEGCFDNCSNLAKVFLNIETDTLEARAFENCSNLRDISNSDNIKMIYTDALANTPVFESVENGPAIIGSVLYTYKGKISEKEYIVPSNVTCLADRAFENQHFQSIKLDNKLLYIGHDAFANCDSLVSLTIPASVKVMEASYGCNNMTALILKDGKGKLSLQKIPNNNIKKFVMGRDVDNIIDWMPNLKYLTIGKEVNAIGNNFASCSNLTNLELEDAEEILDFGNNPLVGRITSLYLGRNIKVGTYQEQDDLYYYDKVVTKGNGFSTVDDLTIGEEVTSICDYFCYGNNHLSSLVFPSKIKTIGKYAFYRNPLLQHIEFNDGLTSIGDFAFGFVDDGFKLGDYWSKYKPSGMTSSPSYDEIVIPATVEKIGEYALSGKNAKKIMLNEGVGSLGYMAFMGCSADTVKLASTITFNGACFNYANYGYFDAHAHSGKGLTFGYGGVDTFIFPETIKEFSPLGWFYVNTLNIPESVVSVGGDVLTSYYGEYPYFDSKVTTSVFIDGTSDSEIIHLEKAFDGSQEFENHVVQLGKLVVNRDFEYDFGEGQSKGVVNIGIDSLVIGDVKEFSVKSTDDKRFIPTTAICLSHYLTSCDMWKPTNGQVFVLPGSQLSKDDVNYMYTVNKLEYVLDADGNVLFDGVNNMPYDITPVFYQDDKEVELKEAGVYDLSMKIAGTSFDGIYPTGLKVTVVSTSGINQVTMNGDANLCPIYNMNGQRVDESYKGVVIQNGKKRIAK